MNEVKIAPCPMPGCGGKCTLSYKPGKYWIDCMNLESCTYSSGIRKTGSAAIAAHNALCADIEKGRRYDTYMEQVEYSLMVLEQGLKKKGQHLVEAVRLLDMIMSGSDSLLSGRAKVTTFLALDDIKTILKQKGQ